MTLQYPTIADCVGNTPLVRLQRMAGETSNILLLKLEGNNPAGSVKDRPALSMITRAELRGQIKPGDTLIEATSGNTGIALAMAAAIKGYKMILIMPDNGSAERKAAMTAYGAELLLVTPEEGMEGARDLAERMAAACRGLAREAADLGGRLVAVGLASEETQLLYGPFAILLVLVYTELPFAILPIYAAAEKFEVGSAISDLGAEPVEPPNGSRYSAS